MIILLPDALKIYGCVLPPVPFNVNVCPPLTALVSKLILPLITIVSTKLIVLLESINSILQTLTISYVESVSNPTNNP